jgi:sterol desaturase/sphingolipid hydroxylase (fatty acid hydroxylase superfamily)
MIAVTFAVVAGAVTWTLLEYVIHRWLGHDRRFRGNPFGVEHIEHHIVGDYFAPTWKKVLVAGGVAVVVAAIAILLAGPALGGGYVAGLIGWYAAYEVLHRREHTHGGIGSYGRWARRHHFYHHLVDARTNFGVTSPVWDLVFGTYRKPGVIKVPPKLAMVWLVDRQTGSVHARYADTFVLR